MTGRTDAAMRLERDMANALTRDIRDEVTGFAETLAQRYGGQAVLFYGSNLRHDTLEGVLDFYVLTRGPRERGLWPKVAYHELTVGGEVLRAKVAIMRFETFRYAARGDSLDTTIWARFAQPCAIAWAVADSGRGRVASAIADAVRTAARFAAVLGPEMGAEHEFWKGLFAATYKAELRVEAPGREDQILTNGADHFDGLLTAAWEADGIAYARDADQLSPHCDGATRRATLSRWRKRRRFGKILNVMRLLRAGVTFEGGARYLAWKIERHSGVKVPLTPFQERHPILAAPAIIASYWRAKSRARSG